MDAGKNVPPNTAIGARANVGFAACIFKPHDNVGIKPIHM
jgi:hypothetical protein